MPEQCLRGWGSSNPMPRLDKRQNGRKWFGKLQNGFCEAEGQEVVGEIVRNGSGGSIDKRCTAAHHFGLLGFPCLQEVPKWFAGLQTGRSAPALYNQGEAVESEDEQTLLQNLPGKPRSPKQQATTPCSSPQSRQFCPMFRPSVVFLRGRLRASKDSSIPMPQRPQLA